MRKQYDKEFKEQALQYKKDNPNLSVRAVCDNLGISQPTFYKWQQEAKTNGGVVNHRGSGNYASDEEKEIARLRRELKAKDDALKILKKAIGILGEEEPK